MKKVVGYIFAGIGLLIMFLNSSGFNVPIISELDGILATMIGGIFVAIGVIILMMFNEGGSSKGYNSRRKHKGGSKIKDLPVYEGDDIIAYRRD